MRELRQKEAVRAWLDSDYHSIINAAPRFGKIKVTIDIMKARGYKRPMILYPRKDIEAGWLSDFKKWGYKEVPTFCTFASIKNLKHLALFDVLIIDEIHELSPNQQEKLGPLSKTIPTLGLSGTITAKTAEELYDSLNVDTCYKYTIEQAVEEGILADYEIIIHRVPLDNKHFDFTGSKGKRYTEKQYFDLYAFLRKKARQKYFMDVKMIQIIQGSRAKADKTRELLRKFRGERVLVFCGTTQIADSLEIPVYHSKSKEKEIFNAFCNGEKYAQLATIKMMQAGITITPINRGIINYTSGNPEDSAQKLCRFLGFEYANTEKKAEIHIISSDEPFEIDRLSKGLSFFDKKKIKIITN